MPERPSILCIAAPLMLSMLTAVLENYGFSVRASASGDAGLKLATDHAVGAVLLDYEMPDVSAASMARLLRSLPRQLPLVLYTSARGDIPQSVVRLVDAVVSKGEPVLALVQTLQGLLQLAPRRVFPRYSIARPITVRAERRGDVSVLQGQTSDLSESGLGGVVQGDLAPGELVLLNLNLTPSNVVATARVCYRRGDRYGFHFFDIGQVERARILRTITAATPDGLSS